jgi:hypothetical protein
MWQLSHKMQTIQNKCFEECSLWKYKMNTINNSYNYILLHPWTDRETRVQTTIPFILSVPNVSLIYWSWNIKTKKSGKQHNVVMANRMLKIQKQMYNPRNDDNDRHTKEIQHKIYSDNKRNPNMLLSSIYISNCMTDCFKGEGELSTTNFKNLVNFSLLFS